MSCNSTWLLDRETDHGVKADELAALFEDLFVEPEAKAVLAAVRVALTEAALAADGVRTVSLRVTFADVFPSADGAQTFAVLRVRAVTEEVEV